MAGQNGIEEKQSGVEVAEISEEERSLILSAKELYYTTGSQVVTPEEWEAAKAYFDANPGAPKYPRELSGLAHSFLLCEGQTIVPLSNKDSNLRSEVNQAGRVRLGEGAFGKCKFGKRLNKVNYSVKILTVPGSEGLLNEIEALRGNQQIVQATIEKREGTLTPEESLKYKQQLDSWGQQIIEREAALTKNTEEARAEVWGEYELLAQQNLALHPIERTNKHGVTKFYLPMQYLGIDLFDYLEGLYQRYKRLSDADQLDLAIKVALKVDDFHQGRVFNDRRNRAHLDLKLENITIDSSGKVHLIDFAFASFLQKPAPEKGTLSYMPQQLFSPDVSLSGEQADIFALKRVLFFPKDAIRYDEDGSLKCGGEDDLSVFDRTFMKKYPELGDLLNTTQCSAGEENHSALYLAVRMILVKNGITLSADERQELKTNSVAQSAIRQIYLAGGEISRESLHFDQWRQEQNTKIEGVKGQLELLKENNKYGQGSRKSPIVGTILSEAQSLIESYQNGRPCALFQISEKNILLQHRIPPVLSAIASFFAVIFSGLILGVVGLYQKRVTNGNQFLFYKCKPDSLVKVEAVEEAAQNLISASAG